mgnify:CR=1 FL=1
MPELAYSLHLGSDKNRKNVSRARAKSNASGTTSQSNNAIQNVRQLSRVDKHNYRKYDDKGHLIEIVRGTTSLYSDVQKLYKDEFEEARLEYNSKQTRDDRKIDNYFKKISDNSKNDLACEIIIELGDKKYWDTKDEKFKHKMSNVYKEQVKDLETLIPNFKVASAIIHYDETSPHMHIVGVPIKYKSKNGMSKQVGKSDVFTKTKLIELQDKMRTLCIASFNKEYGLNNEKARWIAGFLVEDGLLEEPQYLHLKATTFGMEFANTLPLTDKNVYMEEINSKENIVAETKKNPSENDLFERLSAAALDPLAEGKASGVAFEEEIAKVFRYMGFEAKRVGGPGNTDVVVRWIDDEGKKSNGYR